MKDELIQLIKDTIIKSYTLKNDDLGIDKSVLSNSKDYCFKSAKDEDLAKIILDSIIDYSYDSFEIKGDPEVLFKRALYERIRYNHDSSDEAKLSYGFFGEVLLHSILRVLYNSPPLISKGHFFIEGNGESKGYDSYHLVQNSNDKIHLWFGEVKFRETSASCLKSALDNLDKKILTDEYFLKNNLIPIFKELEKNPKYEEKFKESKLFQIKEKWINKGKLSISDFKSENISVIYPILISCNHSKKGYDATIKNCINYILKKYENTTINKFSLDLKLFFIFLPVNDVKEIKQKVLEWIDLKELDI